MLMSGGSTFTNAVSGATYTSGTTPDVGPADVRLALINGWSEIQPQGPGLVAPPAPIPNASFNGTSNDGPALQAAITAAGSTRTTLNVIGPMLIGANLTVPSNIILSFAGSGLLRPAAGVTITINGAIAAGAWQIFDTSNSGSLINGSLRNDRAYAEWFGAIADGATDSTTALNNALALAHAASDIPVQLLAGTYVVTSTLVATGQSFTRPNLQGVSKKQTILSFTGIGASSVCLKIRGGSGQITGDAVSDLTLLGNSTSILLEFNGACGARARNVLFSTGAVGVRWHNELASSFTEFCTAEGCETGTGCLLPYEYKVTSGNNSFHGSGPGGGTENVVQVGASGTTVVQADGTGCFVYNAPCHLQVFCTSSNVTIFQNNNSVAPVPISFAGTVSIETASTRTITLGAGAQVFFVGPVRPIGVTNLTGDNVVAGTFLRVETVTVHADSSTSFSGAKAGRKFALTVPTASMAVISIASAFATACRLIDFNLFASNYLKRFLLLADYYGDGSTGITPVTVGQHGSLDNPGGTLGYQQNTFTGAGNGNINVSVPTVAKVATASFTGGETQCNLTLSWQSPGGVYNWQFSNGDVRAVTCAFQSTGPHTWTGGLSGAATTAITAQTWPNGSSTFTAHVMETQISNGQQASGHMQF